MSQKIIKSEMPEGTNYCIGSFVDKTNQLVFYCNENSLGKNGIYKYDIKAQKVTKVYSYKGKKK